MGKFVSNDLTNQRFVRLVAIECVGKDKWGSFLWRCRCDCGATHITSAGTLRNGNTKSCGCLRGERHGHTTDASGKPRQTRTYKAWYHAKARCNNPKDAKFKAYGGRGIRMCPEWLNSFSTFLKDMGECPPDLTLDRIDVNGNYEPSNCRWATWEVQNQNKRPRKKTLTFASPACSSIREL